MKFWTDSILINNINITVSTTLYGNFVLFLIFIDIFRKVRQVLFLNCEFCQNFESIMELGFNLFVRLCVFALDIVILICHFLLFRKKSHTIEGSKENITEELITREPITREPINPERSLDIEDVPKEPPPHMEMYPPCPCCSTYAVPIPEKPRNRRKAVPKYCNRNYSFCSSKY